MFKVEEKYWVLPVIITTTLIILIMDYFTPKGSAEYVFYFIPVSLSVLHSSPRLPFRIALVTTILCILGYFLSPASDVAVEIAQVNRLVAIVCMWAVASLVKQNIIEKLRTEENIWLKNGINQLASDIRGELTAAEIAERILTNLAGRIDSKVGAIFMQKEGKNDFQFLQGYAYQPAAEKSIIKPGEGLLGQAILSKKVNVISPLEGHLKLTSALGESQTSHIVVVPLISDNEVIALLELGFLSPPPTFVTEFLSQISESAAIGLRSAEHKRMLALLLNQSQQYAEELQAQQEELRVSNEELEQQSRALKESHMRLENQQAEMEQTNQQLEEQTQELEHQKNLLNSKNTELELKSEEVMRASKYKSEFLANMSHELRTPLNSSLILAKLLMDNKPGNLTKDQIEFAQIIYNSGNDLLNLINDILDLSKVEAGKLSIVPEIVLIDHVVKNTEQIFRPVAKQKHLEFKTQIDPDVPKEIITDRQRLEQILKNFLSNAFKFTHTGGVILKIFMKDNKISFAVIDTGVGMDPEEQKIVFEAFRQADGTTNRKYGGTGLGLSISKELGHVLEGEISVSSIKNEGSTFTLSLPTEIHREQAEAVKPVLADIRPPVIEKKAVESVASERSFQDDRDRIESFPRRMLIIEDDVAFAKILYDLAHEMNFGAIVAHNCEEGLTLARIHAPNAIVLDIRLPDHSGMIVLDQLKKNTKTRHIPVHVISSEDFSRSALEMGAIGYMLKPVKKEQLLEAFQHFSALLENELKKVLIVEDEPVQRQYITQLISDQKIEVTAVETSAEALKELASRTFDCMIMDLSLPDMSGHELLCKLSNETSTYSFPPVIVYTARDLTPEEEEKLRLYSGSIIIKGAKSPERLLSEVTLFLHKVETELPPERQRMLKELRSREKSLEDKTILVVDDDIRNIFALTAALETQGAKIVSSRNGKEALEKISPTIDLVLMDIMMPEMDGYEAMRRLREDPLYKDVPILALTAKAMKDDMQKCLEAGANDYLSKPIDIEKLMSLIRVWLPPKRKFS